MTRATLIPVAGLVLAAVVVTATQLATSGKVFPRVRFGPDARVIWTPGAASEIGRHAERAPWKPAVNPERPRGGIEVYSRVAPAVVVVRTDTGHGTGFIVSADGLVLTNHHVVADGLRHDAERAASYAMVHLGRLGADGIMNLRSEPVRGLLLKSDPAVDLALLKLDPVPPDLKPLPFLAMAPTAPRPGLAATIVGHPASGMLWTLRSGQVSSIGLMPADLVDVVMLQLSANQGERSQVLEQLKQAASRRIILTSAGANPGDSGGPVVDGLGRVIAVTFAVPSDPARAKFSYHIHLDEVKAFLATVPKTAILSTPDPWQLGPQVALTDLDNDGRPDVLLGGAGEPEELLFDLDNDTPAAATKDLTGLVRDRKWDFEFALRIATDEPTSSAFYDTNNDGTIDLIHTVEDRDHSKNTQFSRTADGKWGVQQNVALTFPSGTYLTDTGLAQKLAGLLQSK
jgi:serine protease Do